MAFAFSSDAPQLGSNPDAVAAVIQSPNCDGTLDIELSNETARAVTFSVFADNAEPVADPIRLTPRQGQKTLTYTMTNSVETLTVDVTGRPLTTRKVGKPDPCLVEQRVDWGSPVQEDNFDSLDPAKWAVYDSPDAPQHPRTPEAVSVTDGILNLAGGFYDTRAGRRDVSGGMAHKFGQMYGKWEVKLKADPGEGYSPVMLLWPDSEKWPDDGEVDAIEIPAPDRQAGASFLHNGPNDNKVQRAQYFDWTQWHVVSVEWLPDRITIAVDGIDQWHVIDRQYIPSTSPMHLTLQNDQGTEFTPPRTATTPEKVAMHVDWIKVYAPPPGLQPQPVPVPVP